MGVHNLFVVDPFNLEETTEALDQCLSTKGLKVVITRRECAIQSNRRNVHYAKLHVNQEKCTKCKICIAITGCPALYLGEGQVFIDENQCNGCSLCAQVCPQEAFVKEEV